MKYRTVFKEAVAEELIRKSRFIGAICPVSSVDEAEDFIARKKQEHIQATHNCSAYIVGEDSISQKYSDDGEPQGTAGMPMLEVLRKEDLTNVCCVVTRYFGGIKLGASGLVRAYSGSCRLAVSAGIIVGVDSFVLLEIIFDYTHMGRVEYFLKSKDYDEKDRSFGEKVTFEVYIPESEEEAVTSELLNLTDGSCTMNRLGSFDFPVTRKNRIRR